MLNLPTLPDKNKKGVRWTGTILGIIFLGSLGSGIWELAFKPGVTTVGTIILRVLTFGSQQFVDLPFASAAMDPTAIPGLVTVTIIFTMPFGLLGLFIGRKLIKIDWLKDDNNSDNNLASETKLNLKKISRHYIIKSIEIIFIVFSIGFAFVAQAVSNRSILVWRTYHTNLRILSPDLTSENLNEFESRFASMQSKSDYLAIEKDMLLIAEKNSKKIHLIDNF